jgi:hypothetical protein
MSDAAAGLTPEQEAIRRGAIADAAQVLAPARAERDQAFADAGGGWQGALIVGRLAHPRDPERAEKAARLYLGWAQEEIAKRDAAGSTEIAS